MSVDRIEIRLPDWLFRGDTAASFQVVGWDAIPTSDTQVWHVALVEDATPGSRPMLQLHEILGPEEEEMNEEHPALVIAATGNNSHLEDLSPQIAKELDRLGPVETINSPHDLTRLLYVSDLELLLSDEDSFGSNVNKLMRLLRPEFPNAALYFIEVDRALSFRTGMTRVLMRLADEPRTFQFPPLVGPSGLMFQGGIDLTEDLSYGLRAFLDPLLLSLSPFAWGHRHLCESGILVFSFGAALAGRSGEPSELLHLFGRAAGVRATAPPPISPTSIKAAIDWWVIQLNALLSTATDVCHFRARDGSYDVSKHQEHLFTLNQAFRAVQSIPIQHRDGFARQSLLFNALDSLAMLTRIDFDHLVEAATAQRILDRVRAGMPVDAQPVLIPRAAAAVETLTDMRKSFGIGGRVSSSGVSVPGPSGKGPASDKKLNFDRAVAQYLRIRRNASHGYGGRDHKDAARDRVLLSSHSGHLPSKVADLSYLYALSLLSTGLSGKTIN